MREGHIVQKIECLKTNQAANGQGAAATAPISITSSLTALSMAAEKSNSSSFLIFGKQPRRGNPNYATSSAHAKLILGSSQAKQPKQWPLPQHLLGPCQADSWPLPADVSHHPDGCPATAISKKKTRKINFFLHRCGTEKTKKSTKYGPLHGQDVEDC